MKPRALPITPHRASGLLTAWIGASATHEPMTAAAARSGFAAMFPTFIQLALLHLLAAYRPAQWQAFHIVRCPARLRKPQGF